MNEFMEKITARTNDKIKYAVRLGESASLRKEAGEFFLEGARLCFDAAQTGIEIKQVFLTAKAMLKYEEYISEIISNCGICYEISVEVSQKLSGTESAQGVFCVCGVKSSGGTDEIKPDGKYIALENIQDPSNLGAICRSAEAIGLDGMIVSGGCDVYNPKALRASMGSLLRMNVIQSDSLKNVISQANQKGMLTLASVPRNTATDIRRIDMSGGVICCIGNEGSGLSPEVIDSCKMQAVIPMNGRAESFNASAAAAIMSWEMKR